VSAVPLAAPTLVALATLLVATLLVATVAEFVPAPVAVFGAGVLLVAPKPVPWTGFARCAAGRFGCC